MILVNPDRIHQMVSSGHWGTRTLYDAFLTSVERHPDQEAVVDPPNREAFTDGAPRRLDWRTLRTEVEHLSALLYQQGLRRDDIVIVQLPNSIEQVEVYLACHRLGAVVSPLPAVYREHEIRHAIETTRAAALITASRIGKHGHGDMMIELARANPCVRRVLVFGSTVSQGAVAVNMEMKGDLPLDETRDYAASIGLTADDVFSICWTSGTEARPKGVPRSSNEWYWQARGTIDAAGLEPGMRMLNPFPLVNMGGMSWAFVGWLLGGGTLVQHHPFDLEVFLAQIRDERIEYTVVAPAILNRLLQHESLLQGIDFNCLKRIGSGSAPLSPWMIETYAARHGVHILNFFGSNEGAALCGHPQDIPDPTARATLFPRPHAPNSPPWSQTINNIMETRLVDPETGAAIHAPGQPGELRIAGPTVFSGYYNAPDITAQSFDEQGFFKTGDLFEIAGSAEQYLRYVGRLKDLVIRGGMKISAEEIEALVLSHPDVAEVAAVGYPDPDLGERLCLCVVPRPGCSVDLESLVRFLFSEKQVAPFKRPERLIVLAALPRNPVGKVVKRELRELAKSGPGVPSELQ